MVRVIPVPKESTIFTMIGVCVRWMHYRGDSYDRIADMLKKVSDCSREYERVVKVLDEYVRESA